MLSVYADMNAKRNAAFFYESPDEQVVLKSQFFPAEDNGDPSGNTGVAGNKNLAADAVRA